MCVIIVKNNDKKIDTNILRRSSVINPHGLGVVWLDSYEITYHQSREWKLLQTDRPFIAHFRYATIGKVCKDNIHPFPCGNNPHEYLMQNGTIKGYGSKDMTDTQDLANHLCDMRRAKWKKHLAQFDCRFVTVNTQYKSYQIYNKDDWYRHDGVWYSKDNVLMKRVAVYGTLKQGYGNHGLIKSAKFVGKGKTKSKYPLRVSGLPYMYDTKGVGHNVDVEVYDCDHWEMIDLDRLEGHPNFYERKVTQIVLDSGEVVDAWVYFINEDFYGLAEHQRKNVVQSYEGTIWNRSTKQSSYDMNTWDDYEWSHDWDSYDYGVDYSFTPTQTKTQTQTQKLSDLQKKLPSWTINSRTFANDNICPNCSTQCLVDEYEGLAYCTPCGDVFHADTEFPF